MVLLMQKHYLEVESQVNSSVSNSVEISSRIVPMGGFQTKEGVLHKDGPTDFFLEISNYTSYL